MSWDLRQPSQNSAAESTQRLVGWGCVCHLAPAVFVRRAEREQHIVRHQTKKLVVVAVLQRLLVLPVIYSVLRAHTTPATKGRTSASAPPAAPAGQRGGEPSGCVGSMAWSTDQLDVLVVDDPPIGVAVVREAHPATAHEPS